MLHAYIDESGDRGITPKASDYFIASAVIVRDKNEPHALDLLAHMRKATGRQPGQRLHFTKLDLYQKRVAADMLGRPQFLLITAVIVCKRYLAGLPTESHSYLYTLKYLLERLSWLARGYEETLDYTISHVIRFDPRRLAEYEAILRATPKPECQIDWSRIPSPGVISRPENTEMLQLADVAASAIARAFNLDPCGLLDRTPVTSLEPRLRCPSGSHMTTYGLKIHPTAAIRDHDWVNGLRP